VRAATPDPAGPCRSTLRVVGEPDLRVLGVLLARFAGIVQAYVLNSLEVVGDVFDWQEDSKPILRRSSPQQAQGF